MPKIRINEIEEEERYIFLKRLKMKDFEENFDYYCDEIKLIAEKKGYEDNEIKYIKEGKYVNIYAIIMLEF